MKADHVFTPFSLDVFLGLDSASKPLASLKVIAGPDYILASRFARGFPNNFKVKTYVGAIYERANFPRFVIFQEAFFQANSNRSVLESASYLR